MKNIFKMVKIKKPFIKREKLLKKNQLCERKFENFNKLSKYALQKILKLAQMIVKIFKI